MAPPILRKNTEFNNEHYSLGAGVDGVGNVFNPHRNLAMNERVFVFTETESSMKDKWTNRPRMYAFRENEIKEIRSQWGSQNCYLVVNGLEVNGSFDDLVSLLGERIDIK